MDIFLGSSFIFVFCALIKLAILKYLHEITASYEDSEENSLSENFPYQPANEKIEQNPKLKIPQLRIDEDSNSNCDQKLMEISEENPKVFPNFFAERPKKRERLGVRCLRICRRIALILYPTCFIAFCAFYFLVFLGFAKHSTTKNCLFDGEEEP